MNVLALEQILPQNMKDCVFYRCVTISHVSEANFCQFDNCNLFCSTVNRFLSVKIIISSLPEDWTFINGWNLLNRTSYSYPSKSKHSGTCKTLVQDLSPFYLKDMCLEQFMPWYLQVSDNWHCFEEVQTILFLPLPGWSSIGSSYLHHFIRNQNNANKNMNLIPSSAVRYLLERLLTRPGLLSPPFPRTPLIRNIYLNKMHVLQFS